MRKFLPYIFIFTIIASTLAPFSVTLNSGNRPSVTKNESLASWPITKSYADGNDSLGLRFDKIVDGTGNIEVEIEWENVGVNADDKKLKEEIVLGVVEGGKLTYTYYSFNERKAAVEKTQNFKEFYLYEDFFIRVGNGDGGTIYIKDMKELTKYSVRIETRQYIVDGTNVERNGTKSVVSDWISFTTEGDLSQSVINQSTGATNTESDNQLPACHPLNGAGPGEGSIIGCVAQIFYYVIYKPTSWLFAGAGMFFDFIFDYSLNDESYKSSFVTEGWKIVRDICNIFFIFILLYIAFTLVLGMQNIKAKEMIVNVIIIGILINFSLFFAQVVIDSGNILARIFYNSQTVSQNTNGGANVGGAEIGDGFGDEISLSAGLVSKINPQKIVQNASKVQVIDPQSGTTSQAGEDASSNLGAGGFILVTFLAVIVNLVGIFVFISVALIFVARVIGLWFAMIFAPFAFLSYTIPAMSKIKMLGWKNWWSDLISLSFVAPLFMFMLYLILVFVEKGFGDIVQQNNTGVKFVLSVIIPFVFIMAMLMMAKKLAKEYSGSMGQKIVKGINTVAALAGGAALGGAAIAGRATLGRAGSAIASSDKLKRAEAAGGAKGFGAKMLLKGGKSLGSGSMDLRGVKVAGKSLSSSDFAGSAIGKPQVGGFAQRRKDKVVARQERMRELEVGEDSKLTQDVRGAEAKLNEVQSDRGRQNSIIASKNALGGLERALSDAERDVANAERALKDASDQFGSSSAQANTARATRDSYIRIKDTARVDLESEQANLRTLEAPINQAKDDLQIAKNAVIAENRERRENYARTIRGNWSHTVNFITSRGQHAVRGEREASNRILSGIEQEKNV